jgi:hypothetical protein
VVQLKEDRQKKQQKHGAKVKLEHPEQLELPEHPEQVVEDGTQLVVVWGEEEDRRVEKQSPEHLKFLEYPV